VAVLALLSFVTATSSPLFAQAPQTFSLEGPDASALQKSVDDVLPSERFALGALVVDRIVLAPLDPADLLADDLAAPRTDRARRYGVARDVSLLPGSGTWSLVGPDLFLWSVEISSPGAIGIRARLELELPKHAALFVASPDNLARIHGPYEGRGPFEGDPIWTPTSFGDTLRIELLVPAASLLPTGGRLPFKLERIQHIYLDPVSQTAPPSQQEVGSCHNDPTCYPAWSTTSNAVAGIGFIQGDSLYCSGQLINSQAGDFTPYLLTANHCIGNNSTAQSSEIYWLYQSSTCNGAPPSLASVPQSAVTTLLATKAGIGTYDFSLLMVEGALPGGLGWVGWNAGSIPNGTDVTGIHHPDGSYKRISFGTKIAIGDPDLVQVGWYDGPTEPGSSGSGLFDSSTQQLIGQLSTGSSFCGFIGSGFPDQYGAFSKTYPDISSLLAGGSDDGFENNDTCAAAASVGNGTSGNLVVKSVDEDWYSMTVPAGNTLSVTLGFTHAYGDIDMKLFNTCGGAQLAIAESATNNEAMSWVNSTGSLQTVRVQVYLYSDTRNDYSMTITGTGTGGGGGPSNDNCFQAIVVGEGTFNFDSTGATTDGPNEPGACNFFSYTQIGSDIWYRYVPSCTGNATFDLCSSSFDTKLAVYNGSACPGSASADGCNDDACGPGQGLQSQVVHPVVAGNSYLVRIGGYQGATGSGTLSITCSGGGPACQPDLGFQGPGTASFTICGDTSSGGQATIALTGGPANVPAYLVYSLSSTGAPFAGGTLVPFPNYQYQSFTTNGSGALTLVVNGGGGPVTIYCQFALKVNSSTWWLTNAVALTLDP
jgi:V8-like Glu-specific endopeptidase